MPQIHNTSHKISLPLVFLPCEEHKWCTRRFSSNHQNQGKNLNMNIHILESLFLFRHYVEVCEILSSLYYHNHIIISLFFRTVLYLLATCTNVKMHKFTECCIDMQYWTEGNIGLRRSHAWRSRGGSGNLSPQRHNNLAIIPGYTNATLLHSSAVDKGTVKRWCMG